MTNEFVDVTLRKLAASCMTQEFLLEYLLKAHFGSLPKAVRLNIAEGLLNSSEDNSKLTGVARSESDAEMLADVVVDARSRIDRMIGEALRATEEAEGSSWESPPVK